jgi:hypothetical protein
MRGKQCCAGVCATYLSSQALPTQRALQLQFLTSTASDPFRVNAITDEVAARLVGAEHSDDTIAFATEERDLRVVWRHLGGLSGPGLGYTGQACDWSRGHACWVLRRIGADSGARDTGVMRDVAFDSNSRL